MFASIRTYRVKEEQRDEVIRRVDDEWADRLRKERLALSYLVVATGPNELVSVTTSADEKTLARTVEQSGEWVGAHLMGLDVTFVDERRGEVVSHLG